MLAGSTIFALVTYPLLSNLPLNLVRFRWGYNQGLAPMPPEVKKRAEAADRTVLLVIYVVLMGVVVFFLNHSMISAYAVGLTTDNWKSAMALGALLSYVPLSLGAILKRILPTNQLPEELESQGPLVTWCGLNVLGSMSVEFWRAFCIAALIRLELSAWVSVMVVSVAFGASLLTTSIARAAGAATFGVVAGFLFVKTGSLLAPLTMSLIVAGAQLYRVRRMASQVLSGPAAVENLGSPELNEKPQHARGYITCPLCGASFHPGKVKKTMTSFTCPECGAVLEYKTEPFGCLLISFCIFGVPALVYYLGYQNLSLILLSIVASFLIFHLGMAILSYFVPPKAKQQSGYRDDSVLHLTDKPKDREGHRPTDD